MNKTSIKRLLHTVLPFMIMNLVQRSILLLLQAADLAFLTPDTVSLIAFLAASAAAVFTFRQKTYSGDSDTDTPPLRPISAGLSIMHTVISCAAMVSAMYAMNLLMSSKNSVQHDFTLIPVLSALIIHPVIEEIIFRKMFYGELRLMGRGFGCIAQTLMFAILHSTVEGMIYALMSGLILAVLYERTGRLIPCIAAHFFINLRSLLCLTLLSGFDNIIRILDFALVTAGVLCFAVSAVIRTSGIKQEESEND